MRTLGVLARGLLVGALILVSSASGKEPAKKASKKEATQELVPFRWDVPGSLGGVSVGDTLEARGIPMKVSAVKSSWNPTDLMHEYLERFHKAGFYVPPLRKLPGAGFAPLVGLDTHKLLSYVVFCQPEPDGTTTVFYGTADVGARRRAAPDFAPIYPGASAKVQFDLEGARALSFIAKARPEDVSRFYKDVLGRSGYSETAEGEFEKGATRFRVVIRAQGVDQTGVVVFKEG